MMSRNNPIPSPTTLRTHRRRRSPVFAGVAAAALALTAWAAGPAQASHPEVSLPGSNFEIDTNANLKLNDAAPSIDWASVTEARKSDKTSGGGDDSFGQGSKEDTAVPSVVSGSIPPNKSDLLTFGTYLEETAGGDFLHMFWHRVQEPSGTTNMDFEFNQSETLSANGVTPVRVAGDLLIQYDLSQGGTNPQLFLSEWLTSGAGSLCEAANSTPCWSDRINLSASGLATGSINTSAIPSTESDGLGNVSARTFGEASVDFSAIAGDDCVAFGSAYLKSRSSDSFTAALKDFIAPLNTGINNCGALKIAKTMKHAADGTGDHPQEGVTFTVSSALLDADVELVTDENGEACLAGLQAGEYTVTETVPDGYAAVDAEQTAVVAEDTDCDGDATVTFSNIPLTNLTVSVDSQVPGGTFSSISCDVDGSDTVALTDAIDDPSVTLSDLEPRTVVCTIVIDP